MFIFDIFRENFRRIFQDKHFSMKHFLVREAYRSTNIPYAFAYSDYQASSRFAPPSRCRVL